MLSYLIVCPLVFLAGFVDSIAGGGGLISLPAFMIAGVPEHVALGSNKLASSMGTAISTGRYLRNGYVKGRTMILTAVGCSLMAMGGSALGATLSLWVSQAVIRNMMLVVLPVVAFFVLRNKSMGEVDGRAELSGKATFVIAVAAAFAIGAYDGFYGPGTGTFLILVLTGAARMNVRSAAGLTKVINLSSNLAALTTFLINGKVLIPLGMTAGLFCVAGHYLGSGMVVNNGQKIVRPVVLLVLVILFAKVVLQQLGIG